MTQKWFVYVYEEKDDILQNEFTQGISFEFDDAQKAAQFASDMVTIHSKAVVFFTDMDS